MSTLGNSIKVTALDNISPNTSIGQVSFFVKAGSRYETPYQLGVTHYLRATALNVSNLYYVYQTYSREIQSVLQVNKMINRTITDISNTENFISATLKISYVRFLLCMVNPIVMCCIQQSKHQCLLTDNRKSCCSLDEHSWALTLLNAALPHILTNILHWFMILRPLM